MEKINTNQTLFNVALTQYDVSEIKGTQHNPEVVKYSQDFGGNGTDELPWCSAFINWCADRCGLEKTNRLNARSWLKVGDKIEADEAQIGDVVILWRGSRNDWRGHVGLFVKQTDKYIYLLGGNQNNKVKVSKYGKYRVLGYRRLNKAIAINEM